MWAYEDEDRECIFMLLEDTVEMMRTRCLILSGNFFTLNTGVVLLSRVTLDICTRLA